MQGFNFGLRRPSAADRMDDNDGRYVHSSIYSGAHNESRVASTSAQSTPMALQGPFQEDQPRYNPVRISSLSDGDVLIDYS